MHKELCAVLPEFWTLKSLRPTPREAGYGRLYKREANTSFNRKKIAQFGPL